MDTLFSQVDPYLVSRPDPDQTFRSYIDELLAAQKAKGFGGQFVNTPAQQQQQTPQTSITQGLFGKFLGDTGGSGGDYSPGGSPSPSGSKATDTWGANKHGINVSFDPAAAAKGLLAFGPFGLLGGLDITKDPLGKFAYEALLAQEARDAAQTQNALDTAGTLGGVGLKTDEQGRTYSYTSPSLVEAYDLDTFGRSYTDSEGGGNTTGQGGSANSSDMGNGTSMGHAEGL